MAKNFLTIEIEGVSDLIYKLVKFGDKGKAAVKDITQIKAKDIEADAKRNAPVDLGKLKQGIEAWKINTYTWEVVAKEPYSPYVEFGTGTKVKIPPGWEEIAIEFKSPRDHNVNLPARPYLRPAFDKSAKLYEKDLKKALERLIKKI